MSRMDGKKTHKHTHIDQPGKVAKPARGQLNKEINISLSPFASENLILRDGFGSLHTQAAPGAYFQDSPRFSRRCLFIYLNHHTPSSQSRGYRVTQLRTDGVYCREFVGTEPVSLEVVPNGCCLGRSPWTNLYAFFPTPTISMK